MNVLHVWYPFHAEESRALSAQRLWGALTPSIEQETESRQ